MIIGAMERNSAIHSFARKASTRNTIMNKVTFIRGTLYTWDVLLNGKRIGTIRESQTYVDRFYVDLREGVKNVPNGLCNEGLAYSITSAKNVARAIVARNVQA